jgi:hypothetical protein
MFLGKTWFICCAGSALVLLLSVPSNLSAQEKTSAGEESAQQELLKRIAVLEQRLKEYESRDNQPAPPVMAVQAAAPKPAAGSAPNPPMPNMPNMPAAQANPAGQEAPKTAEERLQELERRVSDLESTTVLSEPETRVRRVEVYVDQNGNVHDQPVEGAKRSVTYQRERVYRRQTINEKIEDAMAESEKRNVKVGVSAAIVPQFAIRTRGEGEAGGHAYHLANADLFFTANVAQNTLFYADVVGLSGTPPDLEIPSLTLLNGFSARLVRQNELNLREAWLRTEVFSNKLALSAGRLDLTNYFDRNAAANDETSQFISDALVNNPALGLATNGSGFAAVFDPKIGLNFKFGFQQSNPDATNLGDSLFSLGEIGYLARVPSMGEGNYRFWYRVAKAGERQPTAWGISLDQKLASRVTLFGRYGNGHVPVGGEEGQTAFSLGQHFWSGGLHFQNGLGFFPGDTWGVGYAQSRVSLTDDKEHLVEGFYNFQFTERLNLSFHLTHVLDKQAAATRQGYLVPGIRLQANF